MSHPELEVSTRRFRSRSNRLTKEMAAKIRALRLAGMMQHDIAAHFGINQGRVSEVLNGKRYPDVMASAQLPLIFKH